VDTEKDLTWQEMKKRLKQLGLGPAEKIGDSRIWQSMDGKFRFVIRENRGAYPRHIMDTIMARMHTQGSHQSGTH